MKINFTGKIGLGRLEASLRGWFTKTNEMTQIGDTDTREYGQK